MRFLKWASIVLVVLFCAGWFGASIAIRKGAEAALAKINAHGTKVAHKDLSVSGFPTSWTVALTDISYSADGVSWQGPALDLRATTWAPWHLAANLPANQVISVPGQTITATSAGLTATFTSAPAMDLPVTAARVAGDSLTLASDQGWSLGLNDFSADFRQADQGGPSYVLTFDLAPLHPDAALLAALKAVSVPDMPPSDLPDTIDNLQGEIGLRFSAPLAMNTPSVTPLLQAIDVTSANFAWGPLAFHAEGAVVADDQGFAQGKVMLTLTNWDRLPALLAVGGADPEMVPTVTGLLRAMASQSPDPNVIAMPLVMEGGQMSLGPFPLAEAPRLHAPSGS